MKTIELEDMEKLEAMAQALSSDFCTSEGLLKAIAQQCLETGLAGQWNMHEHMKGQGQ